MEYIIGILTVLAISFVWAIIKSVSKATWNKATEPKDTLKKVERDSRRATSYYGMSETEAEHFKDIQRLGACFARFAMLVSYADGRFDSSEYVQILNFFSGAHPSYIKHISEIITRDLKNPTTIDWEHNLNTMQNILQKDKEPWITSV